MFFRSRPKWVPFFSESYKQVYEKGPGIYSVKMMEERGNELNLQAEPLQVRKSLLSTPPGFFPWEMMCLIKVSLKNLPNYVL